MVGARHAARGQQHHQEQGRHGKADDDGGQHQRLRHGVGIVRQIVRQAGLEHRLLVDRQAQAPHAEDEQIDGIRQQRQAHDVLEGARAQQQPHARAREHANGNDQNDFHQRLTSGGGGWAPPSCAASSARRAW